MLTKEKIAEIKARCEAAARGKTSENERGRSILKIGRDECFIEEFLEHSLQDICDLLEALKAETKRADEAEADRDKWQKAYKSNWNTLGYEAKSAVFYMERAARMEAERDEWKNRALNI